MCAIFRQIMEGLTIEDLIVNLICTIVKCNVIILRTPLLFVFAINTHYNHNKEEGTHQYSNASNDTSKYGCR